MVLNIPPLPLPSILTPIPRPHCRNHSPVDRRTRHRDRPPLSGMLINHGLVAAGSTSPRELFVIADDEAFDEDESNEIQCTEEAEYLQPSHDAAKGRWRVYKGREYPRGMNWAAVNVRWKSRWRPQRLLAGRSANL